MAKKKVSKFEADDKEYRLNEAIIFTRLLQMSPSSALQYIHSKGLKISQSGYYTTLKIIETDTLKQIFEIGKTYDRYRLDRIEMLHWLQRTYMDIILDPKTEIRDKITCMKHVTEMQPYLSAYLEAVQRSIESSGLSSIYQSEMNEEKTTKKKKRPPLADLLTLDKNENVQKDMKYPPKQW